MYTVIHHRNRDCQISQATDTEIVYAGNNKKAAYAFAVEKWLKLFEEEIEFVDNEDAARELAALLQRKRKDEKYYESIHTFFTKNCALIWEAEHIKSPVEEIVVRKRRPGRAKYAKIDKMANKVIQTVENKGDSWL
tara:strand:- start:5533 stop:5940 length:408 start_codon:yes stop_codon:yes gene_type:complete